MLASRSIALITTLAALTSVAGASAASKSHAGASSSHAKVVKVVAAAKPKAGGTVVVAPKSGGNAVAMIIAFPAGGKGSATEQTCRLWTTQLNSDDDALDQATDKDDIVDASTTLNQDKDNALNAGCAVID